MRLKLPLAIGAILVAILPVPPAGAALVEYAISVPGAGTGSFTYDDATLDDASGGNFTSPLTAFSFTYNGLTYGLGDATNPLAWFYDYAPGIELVGIQYLGTQGSDSIEFAAGFGFSDMGSFTGNGGAPGGVGPIALTDSDFQQIPSGVPGPGTLACLLLGLGLAARLRPASRVPGTGPEERFQDPVNIGLETASS